MPRATRRTPAASDRLNESSSDDNDREDSVLEVRTDGGAASTSTRVTLTPEHMAEQRAPEGPSRDAPAGPRVLEDAARAGAGSSALDTERLLTTMMQAFARTQAETNRMLLETLRPHHGGPWSPTSTAAASPAANAPSTGGGGNFSKCTARFDGQTRDPEVLEAFLDAVEVYKECADVTDEHALRGLPMLLTGEAAVWWRGARASVSAWADALARLRATYGVQEPAYRVLREVFASEQSECERADVFMFKVRSLLVKLPYAVPNEMQIDIIYGLLHRRIRKRVSRYECVSFDILLERARYVEDAAAELKVTKTNDNARVVSNVFVPRRNSKPSAALDSGATTSAQVTTGLKLAPNSTADSNERSERNRIKCAYCKSFGHTADECRKADDKLDDMVGSSSIRCYGCGQPGVVRSRCHVCAKKPAPARPADFNGLSGELYTTTSHPLISVGIVGRQGVAVVDTGAAHSVASPLLYSLLVNNGIKFRDTERVIGLADGSRRPQSVKIATVTVTLGERKVETEFMVFPGGDARTLLGRDFIISAGLVIDIAQECWHFADSPTTKFPFEHSYVLNEAAAIGAIADDRDVLLHFDEGTALSPKQKVALRQADATTLPYVGAALLQGEGADEPFRGRVWTNKGYVLTEGVLYRYCPENEDNVPQHERGKVMAEYLDTPGRIQAPVQEKRRRRRGRPRRN